MYFLIVFKSVLSVKIGVKYLCRQHLPLSHLKK